MRPPSLALDLLEFLLPRGCVACGDRIPPEGGDGLVCVRCRTRLRPPPAPCCPRCRVPLGTGVQKGTLCLECEDWPEILVSAHAAVVMESPADGLVHALKYGGWRDLGKMMGRRMSRSIPPPPEDAVVVPVPTTPRRRRFRAYNQARVLAETVAKELRVSLVDALEREKGVTQVKLGPRARKKNVEGSFRLRPLERSQIRGSEVILIDDVLTTGATALSAALALEEGGAKTVRLLTFARALPFGTERGLTATLEGPNG